MTDREQLRERLAEAAYSSRWVGDWSDVGGIEREFELQVIDAILAEIEAAGKVIVDRDRAIRMQQSHSQRYTEAVRLTAGMPDGTTAKYFDGWYQPGDLDPLDD